MPPSSTITMPSANKEPIDLSSHAAVRNKTRLQQSTGCCACLNYHLQCLLVRRDGSSPRRRAVTTRPRASQDS